MTLIAVVGLVQSRAVSLQQGVVAVREYDAAELANGVVFLMFALLWLPIKCDRERKSVKMN